MENDKTLDAFFAELFNEEEERIIQAIGESDDDEQIIETLLNAERENND